MDRSLPTYQRRVKDPSRSGHDEAPLTICTSPFRVRRTNFVIRKCSSSVRGCRKQRSAPPTTSLLGVPCYYFGGIWGLLAAAGRRAIRANRKGALKTRDIPTLTNRSPPPQQQRFQSRLSARFPYSPYFPSLSPLENAGAPPRIILSVECARTPIQQETRQGR